MSRGLEGRKKIGTSARVQNRFTGYICTSGGSVLKPIRKHVNQDNPPNKLTQLFRKAIASTMRIEYFFCRRAKGAVQYMPLPKSAGETSMASAFMPSAHGNQVQRRQQTMTRSFSTAYASTCGSAPIVDKRSGFDSRCLHSTRVGESPRESNVPSERSESRGAVFRYPGRPRSLMAGQGDCTASCPELVEGLMVWE